ncbi:MAG TPA: hypothetical protein VJ600_03275, partial [Holophagaceae bacterium]|nr:hypothetical protein [Holophagaceae bacterium]
MCLLLAFLGFLPFWAESTRPARSLTVALVDEVAGLPKLDVAPLSPGEVARLSRLNFATMPCQGVVQPRVSFLQ